MPLTFLSPVFPVYDPWIHAQSDHGFIKRCYEWAQQQISPFNKTYLAIATNGARLAISKVQSWIPDTVPEFQCTICSSDSKVTTLNASIMEGSSQRWRFILLNFFLFLSALFLLTLPSMDLLKALFFIVLFQIMLFWLSNSFSNKSNELIPMIFAALTSYPTKSGWPCRTMEQWNNLLKAHSQLMNKILQIWALFYKNQCMLWTISFPWPVYTGLEFNGWK